MTQRHGNLVIVATCIVFIFAGCTSTKLPESLLGVWTEDQVKQGLPGDPPQWVKSRTPGKLKFEQQDRKAVVFISSYDPAGQPDSWSEPYPVKETSNNSWSIKYRNREVSIALDDKNQLQVKGLMMRSYNQDLIKKDPEPVGAVYVKKG